MLPPNVFDLPMNNGDGAVREDHGPKVIAEVAGTHLISFQFLVFLFDEELVLCDLGLDGAEERAALVGVHRFVLDRSHLCELGPSRASA